MPRARRLRERAMESGFARCGSGGGA